MEKRNRNKKSFFVHCLHLLRLCGAGHTVLSMRVMFTFLSALLCWWDLNVALKIIYSIKCTLGKEVGICGRSAGPVSPQHVHFGNGLVCPVLAPSRPTVRRRTGEAVIVYVGVDGLSEPRYSVRNSRDYRG